MRNIKISLKIKKKKPSKVISKTVKNEYSLELTSSLDIFSVSTLNLKKHYSLK